MRILTLSSWVAGFALIAGLVYMADAAEVMRTAASIGWGFLLVILIRIVLLYVDSHSWRWLLPLDLRPRLHMAAFQRWIGESVSVLLPFAVVGGELARVRLAMVFGMPGAPAFASIVMDAVVAVVSQVLFFGLGVILFVQITSGSDALVQPILFGGIALSMVVVAMWMAIRAGALGRFAGLISDMFADDRATWLADAMQSVDEQIARTADDRAAFTLSVAWRLLGWLLGAAEIWLILGLFGHPISIAEALMLDALTSAVRTAFFFIPGGLGVQEGALILLGTTIGVSSELMLGVSIVKRAREVILSVPGLLAWQLAETRPTKP
jgi:putative membrane protein